MYTCPVFFHTTVLYRHLPIYTCPVFFHTTVLSRASFDAYLTTRPTLPLNGANFGNGAKGGDAGNVGVVGVMQRKDSWQRCSLKWWKWWEWWECCGNAVGMMPGLRAVLLEHDTLMFLLLEHDMSKDSFDKRCSLDV